MFCLLQMCLMLIVCVSSLRRTLREAWGNSPQSSNTIFLTSGTPQAFFPPLLAAFVQTPLMAFLPSYSKSWTLPGPLTWDRFQGLWLWTFLRVFDLFLSHFSFFLLLPCDFLYSYGIKRNFCVNKSQICISCVDIPKAYLKISPHKCPIGIFNLIRLKQLLFFSGFPTLTLLHRCYSSIRNFTTLLTQNKNISIIFI